MKYSSRELHQKPLWEASDLGRPLPGAHGVSVCLPKWQDVIDYEEGKSRVRDVLQCGYPRFVLHPQVEKLQATIAASFAKEGEQILLLPTEKSAAACMEYMIARGADKIRIEQIPNARLKVAIFPSKEYQLARQFWQHAGEIVSSREATNYLENGKGDVAGLGTKAANLIKERIGDLIDHPTPSIYLFPTGMAAVHSAYRATKLLPDAPSE